MPDSKTEWGIDSQPPPRHHGGGRGEGLHFGNLVDDDFSALVERLAGLGQRQLARVAFAGDVLSASAARMKLIFATTVTKTSKARSRSMPRQYSQKLNE